MNIDMSTSQKRIDDSSGQSWMMSIIHYTALTKYHQRMACSVLTSPYKSASFSLPTGTIDWRLTLRQCRGYICNQ